jgi:hypothetical protein
MKKILMLCAVLTLASSQLFAYWVVLKDGSRYETIGKPTISGNKATFTMKNGQTVQVTADAIDHAKSEEATRLGGGTVIGMEQRPVPEAKAQSSLGSQIRLRRQQQAAAAANAGVAPMAPPPPAAKSLLGSDVVDKFERAYENVGIFEHKMTATPGRGLRADLTTDSEDKVFNAISATAFLIVHNAGLNGVVIDEVHMFMKMTNGGTAGRFQMTRADAQALYVGGTSPDKNRLQEYFIKNVLF